MGDAVKPGSLGGGDQGAYVAALLEVCENMRVDVHLALLPVLVPTFSPPLPPNPLAGWPPQGAPLAKI